MSVTHTDPASRPDDSSARLRRDANRRADLWAASAAICGTFILLSVVVMIYVSGAVSECASGMGQFGQAFDSSAAEQCGLYSAAHTLSIVFLIASLIGCPLSIAMSVRARPGKR